MEEKKNKKQKSTKVSEKNTLDHKMKVQKDNKGTAKPKKKAQTTPKKTTTSPIFQKLEQPELKIKNFEKTVEKEMDVDTKKEIAKVKGSVFHTAEVIFLVLITALIGLIVGSLITYNIYSKNNNAEKNSKEIREFINQYNYIVDNYYDEVDKEELIDSAIAGMLESLGDPYSNYMDQDATNDFDLNLTGTYKGLGIEVYNDKDYNILVSRVFENTPAAKAGIQVGDQLITLDGKNMVGKKTAEFADAVKKGKKDTYQFEVKRNDQTLSFNLKREIVIIPSVFSNTYENNGKKIGYLRVSIFSATTYNQFKTKLEEFEKQNVDGLVIDLRDNSGGHLNVVSDMISLFLDKSNVIYQIKTKSDTEKFYSTGKITKKYPIAILQNGNSASASELMASALQEQYGATVVGNVSYGKGTVQELKNLSDGTQYKFTTKKWLTPKGNWINEVGVQPNITIDLNLEPNTPITYENDTQLQSAVKAITE